ncbi:hypothetical protein BH10CYA1_BH10CYA1_48060 [soil metagenome]
MSCGRTAVFVLREQATAVGERLALGLPADLISGWGKNDSHDSPRVILQKIFNSYDAWVLIMASGIAVRFVGNLLKDKHADPAVVVMDEGCHHAVSLASGHEGGANRLAFAVSNLVNATPVVTTATESIKPLVLGIGCRKNTTCEQIESLVAKTLFDRNLNEIRCVATIDAKANEQGLLTFCQKHDLPMRVFSRLDVAARNWSTEPSAWVQENLGVDGVCEPCALMATARGRLIVPKTTLNGVAVAIVEDSARLAQ